MRVLFCLFVVMLGFMSPVQAGTPTAPVHPLENTIVDANGKVINEQQLVAAVRQHAYVFVGEKHDNPVHHQIELRLIQARVGDGVDAGSVVFEMLDDIAKMLV